MPTEFKDIVGMFLVFFGIFGITLFPALLVFENFYFALWHTPVISLWLSACFMVMLMSHERLENKNYTLKNFWWRWLACEIFLTDNLGSLDVDELINWCKENTAGRWERIGYYGFIFLRSEDALAFKLRWFE